MYKIIEKKDKYFTQQQMTNTEIQVRDFGRM